MYYRLTRVCQLVELDPIFLGTHVFATCSLSRMILNWLKILSYNCMGDLTIFITFEFPTYNIPPLS